MSCLARVRVIEANGHCFLDLTGSTGRDPAVILLVSLQMPERGNVRGQRPAQPGFVPAAGIMQLLTLTCGRQVSAGVTTKPGSSATFMDPKLTSARHTLVLHPLTDFSPSIRSYIYSKLLDVWRLKELQVMCPSVQSLAHPGGMSEGG
jgi:hypothetical protein